MSESRRINRAEKEWRQIIANYLSMRMSNSLEGFVSISRVEAAKDLRSAKVFVSVMGTDEERAHSLEVITDNAGEIQTEISRQIRMKFCPKLKFISDRGQEQAAKIDEVLKRIRADEGGQ